MSLVSRIYISGNGFSLGFVVTSIIIQNQGRQRGWGGGGKLGQFALGPTLLGASGGATASSSKEIEIL